MSALTSAPVASTSETALVMAATGGTNGATPLATTVGIELIEQAGTANGRAELFDFLLTRTHQNDLPALVERISKLQFADAAGSPEPLVVPNPRSHAESVALSRPADDPSELPATPRSHAACCMRDERPGAVFKSQLTQADLAQMGNSVVRDRTGRFGGTKA